jgi:hypothetical protein
VRAESRAAAWPLAHVCSIQYRVPEPRSTQSSDSLAREMVCREELRKCGVRVTTPGVRPENKMI